VILIAITSVCSTDWEFAKIVITRNTSDATYAP